MTLKGCKSAGLFDDYLFGQSRRSKSPLRINPTVNNNPISFSQLSRPGSRHGSTKKGLFRIQIQKTKLKQQPNQLVNPYLLLTGSTQPSVTKSPSKLLNLKSYNSLNRPKSPIKTQQNYISLPRNQQIEKSTNKNESFRVSFSSLAKNQKFNCGGSTTTNESLKENTNLISNKVTVSRQSIKQSTKQQFVSNLLIPKQRQTCQLSSSIRKQPSKCQTSISMNSMQQQDQVNISISGSIADLNLDMNPYF